MCIKFCRSKYHEDDHLDLLTSIAYGFWCRLSMTESVNYHPYILLLIMAIGNGTYKDGIHTTLKRRRIYIDSTPGRFYFGHLRDCFTPRL